jgi:preprotein translocase subunit SecY
MLPFRVLTLHNWQIETSDFNSGLMGLLDMFSGGAFSQASIFALGIMPYISASIVVQLAWYSFPYFQKLQKEGESGRRKMNQYTRYLTIAVLVLQAPTYLINLTHTACLHQHLFLGEHSLQVSSVIILTAGTMFVMWLGEKNY